MTTTAEFPDQLVEKIFSLLVDKFPLGREWFSIKQAAYYTSLSTRTIRRAIKKCELPASAIGGKRAVYRISRAKLEEWMVAKTVSPRSPKLTRDAQVEKYFPSRRP